MLTGRLAASDRDGGRGRGKRKQSAARRWAATWGGRDRGRLACQARPGLGSGGHMPYNPQRHQTLCSWKTSAGPLFHMSDLTWARLDPTATCPLPPVWPFREPRQGASGCKKEKSLRKGNNIFLWKREHLSAPALGSITRRLQSPS